MPAPPLPRRAPSARASSVRSQRQVAFHARLDAADSSTGTPPANTPTQTDPPLLLSPLALPAF